MPLSVLVVDDESVVRQVLAALIDSDNRFTLAGTASDGLEAVKRARAECPDAIICDVHMPVMDGSRAVALLREACPSVAIVMYSSDPTAASLLLKSGADAVVNKSSDMWQLLDEVERGCHR